MTANPAQPASTTAPADLPKKYVPAEHEARIRQRWDNARAFHADPARVDPDATPNHDPRAQRPPYTILIPPPNVTARLHLGHALNNTLQDILVRAHRMRGYETLWMPGTDHAGIATQTVVDRRLKEAGEPALAEYKSKELAGEHGREQFTKLVHDWARDYEQQITDQLKQMGCSCDWERQRFTMDEVCARAVREAFFRLFQAGLIERGKRLVNWDPATQTALADDEVETKDVQGIFAYLRYPICDAHGNATTSPAGLEHLTVATTRPETYMGDTAVAMNPNDPRADDLRGLYVKLPLVGRVIPIITDDYVVLPDPQSEDNKARMATGFLKVTPAHDPNDWAIGERHDADIRARNSAHETVINVFAPDATVSDRHGWRDVGEARFLVGLSREDAKQRVLDEFDRRGLLEKVIKPYVHAVGHSYRSHVPIEPYLSDQWYCKVTDDRLRGNAQRALGRDQRTDDSLSDWPESAPDHQMAFTPARYAKTYENWHDNLKDWCISRQLWWGHRIPVWSKPGFHAIEPSPTRFAIHINDVTYVCLVKDTEASYFEAQGFARDPDVLDTWFSSALWPLSTLGWPEDSELLNAFNPTDVLCTAREIITLWVSRMVMFNRFFGATGEAGPPPFQSVFIHAMIQDGEGRKMSKSLGNGVDPADIIATHGTDAMRFTLCQMTTQTQDVRMPVERDPVTGKNSSPKFDLGRNFTTKLFNAARFATMQLGDASAAGDLDALEPASLALVDRWILSRLARTIRAMDASLGEYQFSALAESIYDLVWRDFCDWYIEAIKPTVRDSPDQQRVLVSVLEAIIRLLHPISPFVTEVIGESLAVFSPGVIAGLGLRPRESEDALVCLAGWPSAADALIDDQAEADFARVQELTALIRETRAQQQVENKRRITLHGPAEVLAVLGLAPGVLEALAGVERTTSEDPEGPAIQLRFEGHTIALSDLADELDAGAQQAKLADQHAKLEKDIGALEKRLNNTGYTEKAPPALVEQTRQQLADKQRERDEIAQRLKELG